MTIRTEPDLDDTLLVTQERVLQLAEKWDRRILGFGTWSLEYRWLGERSALVLDPSTSQQPLFVVAVNSTHLAIVLFANLPAITQVGDNELEQQYLHEWGHVLAHELTPTNPRKKRKQHAAERTATMIGNALLWAYNAGARATSEAAA